jgi:hypothetical protein
MLYLLLKIHNFYLVDICDWKKRIIMRPSWIVQNPNDLNAAACSTGDYSFLVFTCNDKVSENTGL